jgi:hypothetical protein
MSIPRFTAEISLSKASGHYYTHVALTQVDGVMLQEFFSQVTPRVRRPGFVSCDPMCHLDETGACVRDCTECPPGRLPDGCQDFTVPCPSGACCAPGQYVCGSSCCPSGMACCNNVCTDISTDLTNCGMCGNVCPQPVNSNATCSNGTCGFVCFPGYRQCGNSCCRLTVPPLCTLGKDCVTDCVDRCVIANNGDPFGACMKNCDCCCHGILCTVNPIPTCCSYI